MGNLITTTELQEFMQDFTAPIGLLSTYIGIVEAEIDSVLDRTLAQGTYTEVVEYEQSTFDQTGYTYLDAGQTTPKLFLTNYPITTITSVISGGNTVTATSYTYDANNGVLSPSGLLDEPTVTYVAGYTTATCPADLKGVMMTGITNLYYNNLPSNQSIGNVKSKSLKDFSVTYGNDQSGYVSTVNGEFVKNYIASNKFILDRYKRVSV